MVGAHRALVLAESMYAQNDLPGRWRQAGMREPIQSRSESSRSEYTGPQAWQSLAGPVAVQRLQAARTLGSTTLTSRMKSLILAVLDRTRRDQSTQEQSILFWYSACG